MKSFVMRRQQMLGEVIRIPMVLALLLLVSHSATSVHALDHQCIHDTDKMQALISDNDQQVVDGKAGENMEMIRFELSILDLGDTSKYCTAADETVPDFMGGTVTCTADDIFTPEKKAILMDNVLPAALKILLSALKVKRVQGNLISKGCKHYTVPESHSTTGVPNADYVLYVSGAPTTGATVAWASHCSLNKDHRPVNGRANFHPKYLVWDEKNPNAQRQLIRTAVHEILHALGFSSSLWKYFPDGQSPIKKEERRGKQVKYFGSNKVVEKARDFFNCPAMEGPEMEDEGGVKTVDGVQSPEAVKTDGSHWKRRNHKDDIMAGIMGERMYLSPITLAALEDSGHYTVDWSKAETPKWMYKAGCGVIDDKCNTKNGGMDKYFCFDRILIGCAADHRSFGQCSIGRFDYVIPEWLHYTYGTSKVSGQQPLMDYCPIIREDSQCDNPVAPQSASSNIPRYHGTDGRCFKSGGVKKTGSDIKYIPPATCLQTRCVNNAVEFKFADTPTWIACPKMGDRVILKNYGYDGSVVCPDPDIICDGVVTKVPTPVNTIIPPVTIITKDPDGTIITQIKEISEAATKTPSMPIVPKETPEGPTTKKQPAVTTITGTETGEKSVKKGAESAAAISSTIPAVLISSVVFLYLSHVGH